MTAALITELPAAPTRDDPDKFSERGDALMTALPPMVQQINALIPAIIDAAAAGTLAPAAAAAAAASAATALNAPATSATSTSAIAIGVGMKAFTLAQAGKGFLLGQWLLIASSAAPDVNWMAGPLATFNPATGAATVNVKALGGSGNYSAWNVALTGPVGVAGVVDEQLGAPIASAATVNLTAATGNLVHITGNAPISAFTLPAGAERTLVFDAALQVVHNAATLVLPGAGNINVLAGDVMKLRGESAGVRCVSFMRAGAPVVAGLKAQDIVSAATINLTGAVGDLVHVTGTTSISAITIASGAECTVVFDGVLALVNSAALILPGAANIATAPGDSMKVRGDGAAARVVSYQRASGLPLLAYPYMQVREQQAAGAMPSNTGQSGTSAQVVSVPVSLNTTVANSIPGASLSANAVTLLAGDYEFDVSVPVYGSGPTARLFLYNQTTAADVVQGQTSGQIAGLLILSASGRFSLSATASIQLRVLVYFGGSQTIYFGTPSYIGKPEIYAQLNLRKVG